MPSNPKYAPWSKQLKQCQNCMKSESDQDRLSSCSACKRAHYCVGTHFPLPILLRLIYDVGIQSTECQKADWKSHKRICELTRNIRRDMKENPENSDMMLVGVPVVKSDQVSKKWVQVWI